MNKIVTGILSAAMILSSFSVMASAEDNAAMLLPNDVVSGTITGSDNSDTYYMDLSDFTYDVDIDVDVDNAYDVFVEISNADGVIYSADNMMGEETIDLHAEDMAPGRYYVEVYGGVFDGSSLDYTLSSHSNASNPGAFSGINLAWNTYMTTYSGESYWKFTLNETANVKFDLNAPTNKDFTVIVYNENGVYSYEAGTETTSMTEQLNAGTYYVQYKVKSIGENSASIKISK